MRTRLTTTLTVLGATLLLLIVGNAASLAATGKGFVLGKTNKADRVTTLKRTTGGPALSLRTKSSTAPPLKVNGTGLVARLNADRLDGKDASDFASTSSVDEVRALAEGTAAQVDEGAEALAELAAMTPIANGYVSPAGVIAPDTSTGVDTSSWNAGIGRYEIELTSTDYFYQNFHTSVSVTTCVPVSTRVGSVGGKLLVTFTNAAGGTEQCAFTFSTTRLR